MFAKICFCLKKRVLHAYVDIGLGPADGRYDEDGSEAGEEDHHGVDSDQGVGQPVRDCQHCQLKRGGRGIVHHLETEKKNAWEKLMFKELQSMSVCQSLFKHCID